MDENQNVPEFALGSLPMRIASSFCTLFLFLHISHVLRERISLIRRLMIPASLVAGLIALVFVQLCSLNPSLNAVVQHDFVAGWSSLPSLLISILFATFYLGSKIPDVNEILKKSGVHICYVWFLAFGNWAVCCFITEFLLMRVWKVNKLFSVVGPDGFTGGLGAATGHADAYHALHFGDGADLAVTTATFGMLIGLLVGTILINIGKGVGWMQAVRTEENSEADSEISNSSSRENDPSYYYYDFSAESRMDRIGRHIDEKMRDMKRGVAIIPKNRRVSAGFITVSRDAIETLTLHICYVSMAVFLAYWTKRGLTVLESLNSWLTKYSFFSGQPLFPLALLWGIAIQIFTEKVCEQSPLDRGMMERIGGLSIDILVVSGIATTRLSSVTQQIVPLLLLWLSMLIFQLLCFFLVAPNVFPDYWAERACAEFGTMTGATSVGLLLLQSMDPEFATPAADGFYSKQLFFKTFLGGGIITSAMFPLVASVGNLVTFGMSVAAMLILALLWIFVLKNSQGFKSSSKKKGDNMVVLDTGLIVS